jgi:chromosome segregation ATPase
MAKEHSHSPEMDQDKETDQDKEIDLDKTDRLPILDSALFDHDFDDDAVPMDRTAVLAGPAPASAGSAPDFVRPSGIDLPSLAESVRSVEERISRQSAEYDALARAYERSRDAEAAATERAGALAADLAARDSAVAQLLHSLGERDAQLAALQAEHARIVPVLEASSKSTTQLDADLQNARAQADARTAELQASRQAQAALALHVKRVETQMQATRSELQAVNAQASSYLELLQTREWRRGFDQNLFRELDAQIGAAHAGRGALESERNRLQAQVAALQSDLITQLAEADAESTRLTEQLVARDRALVEANERGGADARRLVDLQEAAQLREVEQATQMAQLRSEQAAQIARLQSEAETHEQEMAVLLAHLQEARRPIQVIEAEVRRLTGELAAKGAALAQSEEEIRSLQVTLKRTRGALEEREFLIRRLERSESNNANVLGRLQTSIERLGSAPVAPVAGVIVAAAPAADWSAELIRIDVERPVTHVLSRRTRIGRAAGCELQIEAGSVSRHHALILVGPREAIIEDLNSTNGVFVNGRKVSRQPLGDGDAVTIGEVQFRYMARPLQRSAERDPAAPTA